MSRYRIIGLQVSSPDILEQAIRSLADKLGLQVTEGTFDYYNNEVKCTIGLKGSGLQRGIGFNALKDGSVEVVGDSFRQHGYDEVAETAKNFVNAFQVAVRARTLNPFATTNISIKDRKAILEVAM